MGTRNERAILRADRFGCRYDVVVVGGGAAGIGAALGAARSGVSVLLVERGGTLGGMATAALVHTLCGLYLVREDERVEFANGGVAREVAERLVASGASGGPVRMGKLDVLPHHPTGFAAVADAMVAEQDGLEVWTGADVCGVEIGDAGCWIEVICRGVRRRIECGAVVDTSGDASAWTLAGFGTESCEPGRLQRPAYVFGIQGVRVDLLEGDGKLRLAHAVAGGVKRGVLSRAALGAGFRVTGRGGEVFCTLDLDAGGERYDPCEPACLTRVGMEGRGVALELGEFLRCEAEGFGDSFVSHFPAVVGVRESRRAVTRTILTGDDVLRGARFDDGVAVAAWPMELRENAKGARWRFPKGGGGCEVPLGALRAVESDRVFVAGRCLGCEHEAQAAIRVMGTCLATGEAAGRAAGEVGR